MDATRKAVAIVALAEYQALQKYVLHLHNTEEEIQEEDTRRRRYAHISVCFGQV